eukprot:2050846-Amphidinium_carterae.1
MGGASPREGWGTCFSVFGERGFLCETVKLRVTTRILQSTSTHYRVAQVRQYAKGDMQHRYVT